MPDQALSAAAQPIFYYDLGLPQCYLMAEQILHALPVSAEWQPVMADIVEAPEVPAVDRGHLERTAEELGLQPFRWPARVPAESGLVMLAATYAKEIGRGVSFSLAAFRQAFAGGRDLAAHDAVLIAGAACEIHPAALLKALERPAVRRTLQERSDLARQAGVRSLPAIVADGQAFDGERALQRAAEALQHVPRVRPA